MRAFPVRMPSGVRYWTVIDSDLRVMPVADAYLRHVRFGRDAAESTTKTVASVETVPAGPCCGSSPETSEPSASTKPMDGLWTVPGAPKFSGA